jgi:hypothetical protein
MLCYQGKKDLLLIGYSYIDWGGHVDQSKSTSGYARLMIVQYYEGVRNNLT